jgi:hypothetical protein
VFKQEELLFAIVCVAERGGVVDLGIGGSCFGLRLPFEQAHGISSTAGAVDSGDLLRPEAGRSSAASVPL